MPAVDQFAEGVGEEEDELCSRTVSKVEEGHQIN